MYFLAGNNAFGELTVYHCDGKSYSEIWSKADGRPYIRLIAGEVCYYVPRDCTDASLSSVDLSTGKTTVIGKVPDGQAKQIAIGESGVYLLCNTNEGFWENSGIYLISDSEPVMIAPVDPDIQAFCCRSGGVYYYQNTFSDVWRYDENSGETHRVMENDQQRNSFLFCDGDFIGRTYVSYVSVKTHLEFYYSVDLYDTRTGQVQTFAGSPLSTGSEIIPLLVHNGWLYGTFCIPKETNDSISGKGIFRRSIRTGQREICGPPVSEALVSSDRVFTFGQNGFIVFGIAAIDEIHHSPVYYYYPYGVTVPKPQMLSERAGS